MVPGPVVGVVDYGAGNIVSIEEALTFVGARVRLVTEPGGFDDLDAVVVPGVGAAAPAMRRLVRARLVDPLLHWIAAGRPYLGICLGLQLLFDGSDEDGAATLGVIPGRTVRLEDAPTLPHIGWNQVHQGRAHALFEGLAQDEDFYFVHSFAGQPTASAAATSLAETCHGATFVAAIELRNVLGVQFHPERSGAAGLRLLRNFSRWAERDDTAGTERTPLVARAPGRH
ncbi:MAG: imidazole glycerol phosphate synthase subunit HisH [Chloroflexi bacterium]|nr:imidazole glycerol phosphate synthase subunit HisH [Chloroflexota bacterium]